MAAITIQLDQDVLSAIAKWTVQDSISIEDFIHAAIIEKLEQEEALVEAERRWEEIQRTGRTIEHSEVFAKFAD